VDWTVDSAFLSGVFDDVVVCSDVPIGSDRPNHALPKTLVQPYPLHRDDCRDIEWVKDALNQLPTYDAFAILRPTSPFRDAATIRKAWDHFLNHQPADSLRGVRSVREHPGKMWVTEGNRLLPLLPFRHMDAPWHSSPTQTLPPCVIQTAAIEIAWTQTVIAQQSISGPSVLPFLMDGWPAFDINTPDDFQRAEEHAAEILHLARVSPSHP